MSSSESDLLRAVFAREGTTIHYRKSQNLFVQGDLADGVFLIHEGLVKLTVASHQKEATLAILSPIELFGECALRQPQIMRHVTASAFTGCSVVRMGNAAMIGLMRDDPAFAHVLLDRILARKARIEEDLADQLCNSSEKRLARVLLLLSGSVEDEMAPVPIPEISQETLAGLVGTTRSRVNFFMNKFRKLGHVEDRNGLIVHRSLAKIIVGDPPRR